MKTLSCLVFLSMILACSASFKGPATAPTGPCGAHLNCGHGSCCDAAPASGESWECGGASLNCPIDTCCWTGSDVGPGDPMAARGRSIVTLRHVK